MFACSVFFILVCLFCILYLICILLLLLPTWHIKPDDDDDNVRCCTYGDLFTCFVTFAGLSLLCRPMAGSTNAA